MTESNVPREGDLALIEALQRRPRASWIELASVLNATPTTLAKRWQRLVADRLARVVLAPGPAFGSVGVTAFVSLNCQPAQLETVVKALLNNSRIATVQVMGGDPDVLLTCFAWDISTLQDQVLDSLRQVTGIRTISVSLATNLRLEGSRWRLRVLDPAQASSLVNSAENLHRSVPPFDAGNQSLIRALSMDGRASLIDLSSEIGLSTTTVRRRLGQLTQSGVLRLRCDVAGPLFGWPVVATLWVKAPASVHVQIANRIASRPEVRVMASTTGSSNLIIQVLMRSIDGLPQLELDLSEIAPSIEIMNRAFDLRTVKQMGWTLDAAGRGLHVSPLLMW